MEENNIEVLDNKTKKKKSIGVIIIVIILMISSFVGGYFVNESGLINFNKDNKSQKNKDNNKVEEVEEKEPVVTEYDVNDERVSKLIDKLLTYHFDNCKSLEIFANDKKVLTNDISANKAYAIVDYSDYFNSQLQSISLADFTAAVQKYLGKDYVFNPVDQMGKGECYNYYYDAASKSFINQNIACGGTCGPVTRYKLIKAVDVDGILTLDVKVIFFNLSDGQYVYYSDYLKTNMIGLVEEDDDILFEKGSNYKFTFKLEDGNYVFVSSEPSN